MTVPSEVSSASYVGNAVTTVFSTAFTFLASSEVRVTLTLSGGTAVIKTEGVHYTVTMPASDGAAGSVTMLTAPPAASSLVLERVVPFTQATSFRTEGEFSPEVHEDQFDEVVFQAQQLDRRLKSLESAGAPGSVIAGDGLFFVSTTLHAGAGAGLLANPDDLAVDFATTTGNGQAIGSPLVGVSNKASRQDHQHVYPADVPPATAVRVGNAAAQGSAYTFARSDHQHAVATAAPVDVTKAAAAAGVAVTFAASDHKHDVTTAAAVALTDAANAEGTASSLARSDHTHSHGARGGGTLHADATTAVAGFMSAADKTKLNSLTAEVFATGQVRTTDATPSTVVSITPSTNYTEELEINVVARRVGAANSAGYKLLATVRNLDGVLAQVGATTVVATHETDAAWDCVVSIASPSANVVVTGAAATGINWNCIVRRLAVSSA